MKNKAKNIFNKIKNIKHKKIIMPVILLALIILLCVISFLLRKNVIEKIDEEINEELPKEEAVRDIIFEPYSNADGKLKFLVTIEDKEYDIVSVSYSDKNGENIQLSAKKNKIAIDYETRRARNIYFCSKK